MTGLTHEELALLDRTAEFWNAFVTLPNAHEHDRAEMAADIHRIQLRIMARAAQRLHPGIFRTLFDQCR